MNILHPSHHSSALRSYSPLIGTIQVGHRAISGQIASSGERVHLRAWALVYPLCIVADGNYDLFVSLFNEVNHNAVTALPIDGITGAQFMSLSERNDLIGERATIWMTTHNNDTDQRGAVLAAVVDNMVHLLTLDPYVGIGYERPTYLIDDIILRVAARVEELGLSPTADTMGRLPVLQDIGDLLANKSVDVNWYRVTPTH